MPASLCSRIGLDDISDYRRIDSMGNFKPVRSGRGHAIVKHLPLDHLPLGLIRRLLVMNPPFRKAI
jgi:hypothetical protein